MIQIIIPIVVVFILIFCMGYVKAPPNVAIIISGLKKGTKISDWTSWN